MCNIKYKRYAFTLAEVLITLVIIGVVAALTVPSVVVNHQKKQYVTQLKKSYSNFNNALRTMMAKDGVTRLSDTNLWTMLPSNAGGTLSSKINNSEYANIKNELLKVFNITKIYDGKSGNKINGDGLKYSYLNYNTNSKYNINDGFVMADGSIVQFVLFGSSNASTAMCGIIHGHPCSQQEFKLKWGGRRKFWKCIGYINIDVNGLKGPNKIGRDFFSFYIGDDGNLYPEGGVESADFDNSADLAYGIMTALAGGNEYYWNQEDPYESCFSDIQSLGQGCAGRIMEEGWKMNY